MILAVMKIRKSLKATKRFYLNQEYLSIITAVLRVYMGETFYSRGNHTREERSKGRQ